MFTAIHSGGFVRAHRVGCGRKLLEMRKTSSSVESITPHFRKGCSVTTTATPPFKVVPSGTFGFIWRHAGEVSKRFSTVARCGAYEVKWVDFGQNCLLGLMKSHVRNRDKMGSLFQASETAAKQND